MWLVELFVLGLLSISGARADDYDFSKYAECNFTGSATPSVPVPKLAQEFTVRVEGKLNVNQFFESVGYYHANLSWGSTYITSNGKQSAFLYEFNEGQAFEIGDGKCEPKELFDHGCNSYALFIAEIAAYGNVSSPCNIFGGPTYYDGRLPDNETVRGIPTRRWRQCVRDNKQNMTYFSQYFYSADGVQTPWNVDTPLRFETKVLDSSPGREPNGTKYVYDFTLYQPNIEDESVFLPPPGMYCVNWSNGRENKSLITLPDEFSLTMLTTSHKEHQVHSTKLNFDYGNQLVSFITDSPSTTHAIPTLNTNKTIFRIVHDYNTNTSFMMPVEDWILGGEPTACTVTTIDPESIDAKKNGAQANSQLRHAKELFDMGGPGWEYVGQREFNNMETDVWINNFNLTNITTEVYWLNASWTLKNEPIIAGIITYLKDSKGEDSDIFTTVISDYRTLPFDWRTFDVQSCLRSDSQEVITFTVTVPDYKEAATHEGAFTTGLRNALANLTEITPIRFTDFLVQKAPEGNNNVLILVSILDWRAPTKDNAATQPPATEIYTKLQTSLASKDFTYNVNYGGKSQLVTLLKGSVQRADEIFRPTTAKPIPPTTAGPMPTAQPAVYEGYTGGSMAGLAISMIIIGGVAGLVAGFLLWKRNSGIAYQVYD